MLTIEDAHTPFLEQKTKRLAHAWKITRTDTTKFFFTDHDQKITVLGEEYTPVGSFNASAVRNEAGLRDPSRDFRGAISSAALTTADLRDGKFREAEVLEQMVDWRAPWAGVIRSSKYWIQEITWDGEQWSAQLMGLAGWMQHQTGEEYGRTCAADLGDDECTFSILGSPFSVLVVTASANSDLRFINGGGQIPGSLGDGYYKHGEVEWVTGDNAGLIREIKEYTETGRLIECYFPVPSQPQTGDQFQIRVGCDKRKVTCNTKFSNLVNFRGYPYMPSTDAILKRTPST